MHALRWNIFLFDYTFNKSTSWGKSPGSLGIAGMSKNILDVFPYLSPVSRQLPMN
jgi:hypothetical protein